MLIPSLSALWHAQTGGAVAIYRDGSGTFTDCTFDSNTANSVSQSTPTSPSRATIPSLSTLWRAQWGGAVYTIDSTATISGTVFNNNTATEDGNDVYQKDGTLTCPSECPSGETGTCTQMSSDDCYGYDGTDCTCYSCACSSGLAAVLWR